MKNSEMRNWENNADYHTFDLKNDRYGVPNYLNSMVSNDGEIQLSAEVLEPIYLELGSNVLRLAWLADQVRNFSDGKPSPAYLLENLTAGSRAESLFLDKGHHVKVGRSATPQLMLNTTASREHLVITPESFALVIRDMDSTNGSLVHTSDITGNDHYYTKRVGPSQ